MKLNVLCFFIIMPGVQEIVSWALKKIIDTERRGFMTKLWSSTIGWRIFFLACALFFCGGGFFSAKASFAEPRVYLNHAFQIIDWDTINALRANEFLNSRFAVVKTAVSGTDEEKWKATYIFGKNTYLELFDPDGLRQSNPRFRGRSALALGTDQPADIDALLPKLSTAWDGNFLWEDFTLTSTRVATDDDGQPIHDADGVPVKKTYDWFRWLKVFQPISRNDASVAPSFTAWVMEYNPVFVNETKSTADFPRVRAPEAPTIVHREKYNRSLGYNPTLLFEDIIELEYILGPEESRMAASLLLQAGFQIYKLASCESQATQYVSADLKVIVRTAKTSAESRLSRVVMLLNQNAQNEKAGLAGMVIPLGPSRFEIDSEAKTAVFTFGQLP